MVSFLRLLRQQSLAKSGNGDATFSRMEMIRLFHQNFDGSDISEVFDLLAFNGLTDAESKTNGRFEGFFVTDFGIEFLRHPNRFVVDDGRVARRETTRVDATTWTGKSLILTDEKVIAELQIKVCELRDAVHRIRFTSNSDSQDLKALVEALLQLCEMAAPDIGVIERILAHPKFKLTAGLVNGASAIRGLLGI